uniref:Zinc finger, CCHC-type n=1 Tax=Cannabis sativa TaxID=3483 RepID=A0A803P371_CANSA
MDAARFEIDKFNRTNDFRLWRIKMKALLVYNGISEAIDEESLKEIADEKKKKKKKKEIKTKAHNAILLSLGDEVLREVSSEDKALRMDEGKDLRNHLDEFNKITLNLSNIGVKLQEEDLAIILIHDLKTGYMLERVVRRAGDYVGKLVKADTKNFNGIWREYLRVRATIDIEKPLKDRMKVVSHRCEIFKNGSGLRIMEIDYDNKGEEIVSMNSGKNKGVILGNNDNNGDDSEGENSGKKEWEVAVSDDELLMVLDSKRRRRMEHALMLQQRWLRKSWARKDVVDQLCVAIGFDGAISVNARGKSGGVALLWRVDEEVQVMELGSDYIDVCISDNDIGCWRLTDLHRDTDDWVEVRIDRALVNQSWLDLFPTAKLFNLEASNSNHCPLHLVPHNATMVASNRVFRFENSWLKEPLCFKVIEELVSLPSLDVPRKIKNCGEMLLVWGKDYTRNFSQRIKECKQNIQRWKKGRDMASVENYKQAVTKLTEILLQKEIFLETKE